MKAVDLTRTRVGVGVLWLLLACAAACRPTPPFTKDPQPWEKGSPVAAPELEALLKPTEPTKWSGLRKGTDGRYYYLAELENEPGGDFIERQHKAYQARGVFTRAIGESPHSFPRTLGYEHLIFRKGRSRPWSLYCLEIDDSDSKWISEAPPYRNYPSPSHLEDRLFVFRLGQSEVTGWKEVVVVPDRDVMVLRELPFLRFPGAVISRVGGGKEESVVARWYVARGANIDLILEHYRRVIRSAGFPIDYDRNKTATLWWSQAHAINGIAHITVEPVPPPLLVGKPIGLARVRELAPMLFGDFPDPVTGFQVTLSLEEAGQAAPYQPEEASYRLSR